MSLSRDTMEELVDRGVKAEDPMTQRILSFLPEKYRGIKNENKYGPHDLRIEIYDLSGQSSKILRVELEHTIIPKNPKPNSVPLYKRFVDDHTQWESTMRHYSFPIRKIWNAQKNGWDLLVKFNLSMNAFYAVTRRFILEHGKPDSYSNSADHLKANNSDFYVLSHEQYRNRMILDPKFGDIRFIKNSPQELARFVELFFRSK